MKRIILFLTVLLAFTSNKFYAQDKIRLKNGSVKTSENLLKQKFLNRYQQNISFQNNLYTIVQFNKVPDAETRKELQTKGILLQTPIGVNSYLAEIRNTSIASLPPNVTGVYNIPADIKIDSKLNDESVLHEPNNFVAVMFFGSLKKEEVVEQLKQAGATIANTDLKPGNTVFVKASSEIIQKIAALPFVNYIGSQTLKDVPLNYNNRAAQSVDALQSISGRNLTGKNVTVGIGDNANPNTHIDFENRLLVRTPSGPELHGTHVSGTVGGGGIVDPRYKGMAPQATLLNQYFSNIIAFAPVYISDNHMVVTNNSYFSGANNCPGDGAYDALSNYVDDQLATYPNLLHVFAAGNDGTLTCAPFPGSYGTIKSGYQCAKNVLTVGNIDNINNYQINPGSSRGPVDDGRLKPEIVAGGTAIISTYPNNSYSTLTGTSMSSPTVTGTLALLYERYRQLHGGANPEASLIKAVVCNGAEDKGLAGPDYAYGFGNLNARRAVEALENNTYFINAATNGSVQTRTINNIPAGAQVKIMLYWADPAALPNAVSALINNLDLTVTDASSTLHRPLTPNPANPTATAVEGVDNLNNIEQVVVNNSAAGDFTINVTGTNVTTGPQNYVVAYQIIPPSVTVEYPFGGETFLPNTTEKLRWSYYGNDVNTFSVDYSLDNGTTWINIRNDVAPDSTLLDWNIPSDITIHSTKALIRVTRNNVGYSDISDNNFTILPQPGLTANSICAGTLQIAWTNLSPITTSYNLYMLKGSTLQNVLNTTATSIYWSANKDSTYYFAVEPVVNGVAGRRSYLQSANASAGPCDISILDNNLMMDSILSPVTGRAFTSTALKPGNAIQVRLRNGDDVTTGTSSYDISYQVNSGPIVTETSNVTIPAGGTTIYAFASTYDFSAPGTYQFKTWIKHAGDQFPNDDTLTTTIQQLANDPVTLSPSLTEDFETSASQTVQTKKFGLEGLDRGDFNTNSSLGRLRTFVNTGFARSGNRCATMDQYIYNTFASTDSLTLTFNLSSYSLADQLWLDFFYKNHGVDFTLAGNRVWIRGSDTSSWLPVYTLPANASDFDIYKPAISTNITEVLTAAAQKVSSSFQVRFGTQGYTSANSVTPAGNIDDGYSFDDVTITKSSNDIGVLSFVAPDTSNICQFGSAETVSIHLKNYTGTTLSNVPATMSINGATTTEIIGTVPPGEMTYTFVHTADLSAFQQYAIKAWVKNPGDNYPGNDTLHTINFHTVPFINTFPYVEGFENNDGHWYSDGSNNSWAWGAPSKPVINKAANGSKIWTTNLTGNYNDNELSYLYSPCFDVSGMANPMLSFSHIFQLENCDCDAHWVEYSIDGSSWSKLGVPNSGTNWYNNSSKNIWQIPSLTTWHVASYDLPKSSRLHLRFVMNSDPGATFDGVGIDDVTIFDKADIYSGPDLTTGTTNVVSGNQWIDFNDASGKRVASVNPHGQNLGNTTAKVFFNPGTLVRISRSQYYLDRNIVVSPENAPTDSVSVRFYFLDSESKKLMNATGCSTCTTIVDPYSSGVTQYSGLPTEEDCSLDNNISSTGIFKFILPHSQVTVMPYNNGYYAEYKVDRFSEFWINNGGPNNDVPLPLTLLAFTADVKNAKGILNWQTTKEINTQSFIIEKSLDGIQFKQIGAVPAKNNGTVINNYSFVDDNLATGKNYYRLKMTDLDGRYTYSQIRAISYNQNNFDVSIYPIPATGNMVYIKTSANCSSIELKDMTGKRLTFTKTSGKQNTLYISGISSGVYVLVITTDAGTRVEKIVRE
ncbi:S8 family serine peptidase [Pinibacter soli]|uniref:S8 family serine peptidase n=1 Tax=Pinibacter soli TaxID=3044211 RepID=A0ABT6RJJ1_9BACT|nr:S8 family serine peptidase [Pinibacter soli]MDI3322734.1 S8 family serine peptidase [Pinibacter soli]